VLALDLLVDSLFECRGCGGIDPPGNSKNGCIIAVFGCYLHFVPSYEPACPDIRNNVGIFA